MLDRPIFEEPRAQGANPPAPGVDRYRVSLHKSSVAHVEDGSLPPGWEMPPLYETAHQIILPYQGLFACSVGSRGWVLDANRTLFVSPRQEHAIDHPLRCTGDAALLITPSCEVLDELCHAGGSTIGTAFADPSRPSTMRLRLMTQYLRQSMWKGRDSLRFDEWVIYSLREAFYALHAPSRPAAKLVEKTKQLLHARFGERLSLQQIATEIGVTPAYLTQEFTRSEGTPLYRYQLHLRLGKALLDLPSCDNITGLALDLGFSSHSHFTAVFRKEFGLTPSQYRLSVASQQFALKEDWKADGAGRTGPRLAAVG